MYIDDPEWSYQIRVYNKLLGTTDEQRANPIPVGVKSWAVRVGNASDLPEFVSAAKQVEDDDAFCRLIYRFTVNKTILEIIIRAKTRTNERHDETSERGRNCEIQQI